MKLEMVPTTLLLLFSMVSAVGPQSVSPKAASETSGLWGTSAIGMNPRLYALVAVQNALDTRYGEYAPMLGREEERVPSAEGPLVIRTDRMLYRTTESTIFTVTDHPEWLIKYQCNCREVRTVHVLMRDYLFLKELEDLNLVPKVFFLSSVIRLPARLTKKTAFRLSPAERAACSAWPLTGVRFMLMERVVGSVLERTEAPTHFSNVISTIWGTIRAIEKVHARGIVHGDIHAGNVVLMDRNGTRSIGLIDFGRATFVDELSRARPVGEPPEIACTVTGTLRDLLSG